MNNKSQKKQTPIVACLGEALIDFIGDKSGSLTTVSKFQKLAGGAPANVAVGIARLGISCGFIGKVGDDPFGDFLIETMQTNGVDTSFMMRTKKASTALAFVTRSSTGERNFFFYRTPCADLLLTEAELPQNWLKQIKFLHVGSVSLTHQPSRQATLRAAKIAKSNGAVVTFDPNLRLDLWSGGITEYRRVAKQLLKVTDIFLPSKDELLLLMDTQNQKEAIYDALKLGPNVICIKQGSAGVNTIVKSSNGNLEETQQSAFDVQVVDTTGAGDGFNAGFIAALAKGLPFSEAVRQGCAVAALVITKEGAMTALPTKQQLTRFLANTTQK
jgi:fructokinase